MVFNLGFANLQGFTGRFPGVLGWQLSLHVLLFLTSYTEGKCVPIVNSVEILADLALLWCNNVKSTALPANLGVRVDCFMTRGYLTGKRLRNPDLNDHIPAIESIPTIDSTGHWPAIDSNLNDHIPAIGHTPAIDTVCWRPPWILRP